LVKGVYLAFRDIVLEDLGSGSLGTVQYIKCYKPRQHVSASKIEEHENVKYIGNGERLSYKYQSPLDARYIGFKDLTYDFVLSLYEINSKSAFVLRSYGAPRSFEKDIGTYMHSLNKVKRPSIEGRLIGMQNGQEHTLVSDILSLLSKRKIDLYEVDLFGNTKRNIALDMHTGTTFDILVYDRIYRPGELVNTLTEEQFQRGMQQPAAQQGR
jgi:hypothetical protein